MPAGQLAWQVFLLSLLSLHLLITIAVVTVSYRHITLTDQQPVLSKEIIYRISLFYSVLSHNRYCTTNFWHFTFAACPSPLSLILADTLECFFFLLMLLLLALLLCFGEWTNIVQSSTEAVTTTIRPDTRRTMHLSFHVSLYINECMCIRCTKKCVFVYYCISVQQFVVAVCLVYSQLKLECHRPTLRHWHRHRTPFLHSSHANTYSY